MYVTQKAFLSNRILPVLRMLTVHADSQTYASYGMSAY